MERLSNFRPELIERPTLLLDRQRVLDNIDRMVSKAHRSHVRFRPHFKTHQAAVVGEWFRRRDVTAITVSSVDMALYFAHHGWRDITVAFPANLRQMRAINELAQSIQLNLLVESVETARYLDEALAAAVDVWLKIDTGYGRTGLLWRDLPAIVTVAAAVQSATRLRLRGLLTHNGLTYSASSPDQIVELHEESVARLQTIQAHLRRQGWEAAISIGDTPACSLVDTFEGVDEIRPGNFVFYDLMQWQLGACREEDMAVAVACPVVARHPARRQIILYGGAVHLSKEALKTKDGRLIYGRIARLSEEGWSSMEPAAYVTALSQEHGTVQVDEALFDDVQVGDLLAVLPVHSCLTADLLKQYLTLDGQRIEMAPI